MMRVLEKEDDVPTFKLLVVGDNGIGKSSFIKACKKESPLSKYVATVGVVVTKINLYSNHGPVTFDSWDPSGEERFGGLRDGYYINGQCAIIMFDLTDRSSYNHVDSWYKDITRVCENIPIVLVGNKSDESERKVRRVTFHKRKKLEYFEISVKSREKIFDPLAHLAKLLMGKKDREFYLFQDQVDFSRNDPDLVERIDYIRNYLGDFKKKENIILSICEEKIINFPKILKK